MKSLLNLRNRVNCSKANVSKYDTKGVTRMKAELLKKEGCVVSFSAEVPRETMQSIEDETIEQFSRQAQVKGFRAGKAPRHVVVRQFKGNIKKEILEKQLHRFCHEALDSITVKPLTQPILESIDYELNQVMSLTGKVEVAPEFELADYHGFSLQQKSTELKETDVDEAMTQFAESMSKFETIDNRVLETADFAILDYKLSKEGRQVEAKDGIWVQMGENEPIAGLSDGLLGMGVGETRSLSVTLPDNYVEPELAGQAVDLEATLAGIRVKNIPEMNDDFIKQLGQGFDSLEAYREKLTEHLKQTRETESRQDILDQACAQLLEANPMELPPTLVHSQAEKMYAQQVGRLKQGGRDESFIKDNHEALWQGAHDQAIKQLKLEFIYDKILKQEEISVSEEDMEKAIQAESQSYGMDPEGYKNMLKSGHHMDAFKHKLTIERLLDRILEYASIQPLEESGT